MQKLLSLICLWLLKEVVFVMPSDSDEDVVIFWGGSHITGNVTGQCECVNMSGTADNVIFIKFSRASSHVR